MQVIVAGSNGFIGSRLVKKLFEKGCEVISLVQDASMDVSAIERYSRRIIYCDLDNIDSLCSEFKNDDGIERVFVNLAWRGVNGVDKSNYVCQLDNIRLLCDAAVFAKKIGCIKYVASGSVAENAVFSLSSLDSVSKGIFYGVAKHSGYLFLQTLCKSIGLPFVWAQFSNIFGPGNKTGNLISYTLDQLNKNEMAIFGPADQPYDFVYIDDLIEAFSRIILFLNKSDFYCVSSGTPRLLREYLVAVGKALHKEKLIGIGQRPSDGIKYEFSMFQNKSLVADVGNYISVSFEEGIKKTIGENGL